MNSISKMASATIIISCFGLFVLTGCAQDLKAPSDNKSSSQPIRQVHQSIKGGEVDTSHDFVVGIRAQRGGMGYGTCTGTLIAKNLVLTAQHCVSNLSSRQVRCGATRFQDKLSTNGVQVTTNPRISRAQGSFYSVDELVVPQESSNVCGNDIALIVLSSNIPSSEAEPVKPRIEEQITQETTYTAYGYGATGGTREDMRNAGVRRVRENRQVRCGVGECQRLSRGQVVDTEFMGNGGTCQGDSGGTALDSENRVLGALSRGGRNCSMSIYSSTTAWKDFIIQTAKQAANLGGYDTPSWADGNDDPSEMDSDFDGVVDAEDNCPQTENPNQRDMDGDGTGDVCDSDIDGDGVPNPQDNCGETPNPEQKDSDGDFIGDACDDSNDGGNNDPGGEENPEGPEDPTSNPDDNEGGNNSPDGTDSENSNGGQTDQTNGRNGGGPVIIKKNDDESGGACSTAGEGNPLATRSLFVIGLLCLGFARMNRLRK